ncbi:MAG: lysophospholipid acyltransferase family protein [Deltaproteobacteria bacterium]|nr:lysophospholipid acyltransferase family protein [Deltaproteobacteria bacterium]
MMHQLLARLACIGIWLTMELGRLAVRIVPRRFLHSFSEGVAGLGFYLFRRFRRRSIHNLNLALGERLDAREITRVVQISLRNFFRDFIELGCALEASPGKIREEIPLRGREHLEAALAKGKGVIALSAHLGNFFLVGTRLALEGFPTHVLVNQPQNGPFAQLMDRYRLKVWQKTIHARPRREASRQLLQVLRNNEVAIVIADEYRSGSGVYVPFFGRTVLARRGPATLALRTGAAVVPTYMIRDSAGRLNLVVEPEMELSRSRGTRTEVKENTLRITQWLERVVQSYPDQWNWMNIHWQEGALRELVQKKQEA